MNKHCSQIVELFFKGVIIITVATASWYESKILFLHKTGQKSLDIPNAAHLDEPSDELWPLVRLCEFFCALTPPLSVS